VTSVTSPTFASRQAKPTSLRRASEIVLVTGTVFAVIAAFGPGWSVRLGVAVAVMAAIMACAFAWRELRTARRGHAKAMLAALQDHGRQLTEERTRNAAVVDTLSNRIADARAVIEKLRVMVAELKMQVSGLRGDTVFLAGEVTHRETVITALRETVRAREAELISLRDDDDCEVHHMPRRVLAEHESVWDEIPGVDELWADGSHPTVVDLKMIDTAMVMPNYEVDRKFA
jgi:hypothetical protein